MRVNCTLSVLRGLIAYETPGRVNKIGETLPHITYLPSFRVGTGIG